MSSINLGDFPYDSWKSALDDKFRKLTTKDYPQGGVDAAFYYLVKTWKQDGWRKASQMKSQARREKMTVLVEQAAARKGLTVDQYLAQGEA